MKGVLGLTVAVLASAALASTASVCALDAFWTGGLGGAPTHVVALTLALALVPTLVVPTLLLCGRLRRFARELSTTDARPPRFLHAICSPVADAVRDQRRRSSEADGRANELAVKLRASEDARARSDVVFDVIADAVLVTDTFDEVVFTNAAAAMMLGFAQGDVAHRAIDGVIQDLELRRAIADVRAGASPGDTRIFDHTLPAEDGRGGRTGQAAGDGRPVEVSLTGVSDGRGGLAGVVTVLRDLTRERELAALRTDFVSKASHELRTPLSSVRAYIEMLVDGEAADEEARGEFYRVIQSETERLSRLIDNLLNISRIEAGITQAERETVDLRQVVHRAVETLEPQADEREIALGCRLSSVDLKVEGDADMLLQVVLNLVSNAIKYTPEGGRVTIAADSDNLTRAVHVSVSDTGLGIPPDAQDRLFEKFFRIENYKRIAPGTGLGLNLCKHIVETIHGGQIGVDSTLGMGSRFWFTIPMHYAGANAA